MEYRIVRDRGDGYEVQQRSSTLPFWRECSHENPKAVKHLGGGNTHKTVEAAEEYIAFIKRGAASKASKALNRSGTVVMKTETVAFDPSRLREMDETNWNRLREVSPASFWLEPNWHEPSAATEVKHNLSKTSARAK